jgi:two-component system, LytTR family, sensor kinase
MSRLTKTLSWPAAAIDVLSISTLGGDIAVEGHDGPDVRVQVSGQSLGQNGSVQQLSDLNLILIEEGRSVQLQFDHNSGIFSWFKISNLRFLVRVPRGKGLELNLVSNLGKIRADDFLGELNATAHSGTIRLNNVRGEGKITAQLGSIDLFSCKGEYRVRSFAGSIKLEGADGDFQINADSGSIKVRNVAGKIQATAALGSIRIRNAHGEMTLNIPLGSAKITDSSGSCTANTMLGSIHVEMQELTGPIDMEAVSGNIHLQLPLTQGLDFDVQGNHIKSVVLPDFKGEANRKRIVGKSAGGGHSVRVSARNGSVKIQGTQVSPLSSVERTFTDQTFTLPQHFFSWDVKGIALSFIFCLVMTYGISAVMFLTHEQMANESMQGIYKGIVWGYVLNSCIAVFLVGFLAQWINDRIRSVMLQYLFIFGVSFVCGLLVQIVLGIVYWQFLELTDDQTDDDSRRLWAYLFVAPLVTMVFYYFWQRARQLTRKISEQEFQLLQMEKMKTSAELDALQARINPHFLYNALNSIAGLVHENPDKAEKMTLLLSKMFRFSMGSMDQHYNTIAQEAEIARTYLEVEQVRFGDRLSFYLDIQPDLEEHSIPRFLLQPLVENAVKHGISKVAGPGQINVRIYKEAVYIVCVVADTGAPFDENFFIGYGLKSIQDKLKLLYGEKAFLDIQNQPVKQVVIHLPC